MAFQSGRVSFCRFAVEGSKLPRQLDQEFLDRLAANAFADTAIGAPAEMESGWTAGDHLFDQQFSFDKNVFGPCALFAFRLDTHRPPADLKHAYRRAHEQALAAGNPSGFATKEQKRQAREEADAQIHNDLAAGKYRRSKQVEVLWDLGNQTLFCASSSPRLLEQLAARFQHSFEATLSYLSAGTLAAHLLEQSKRSRDFEDLRPSAFTAAPAETGAADDEAQSDQRRDQGTPSTPWTASAFDTKDFLGNEYLIWLWHRLEKHEGLVEVSTGHGKRELAVLWDKTLDMDCAWGLTGKQSLRGSGPTRMAEAYQALRQGKWPRKAGLILADGGQQWELTFQGDKWQIGSAMLPEIEKAETQRQLIEQRLELIRQLGDAMDALYLTFLKQRTSSSWVTEKDGIKAWIKDRKRR